MRRCFKKLLAGILTVSMLCTGMGTTTVAEETDHSEGNSITRLIKSYDNGKIKSVGGVKAYSKHYGSSLKVKADLSNSLALANSLTFSNKTKFSKVPEGFSQEGLLSWGKYPGLNIDILHKYGYTGKGAVVAYVDQPVEVKNNEQYKSANVHYKNNSGLKSSMHGPAVLSLLVGKDTGTAPDTEVYYYAHAAWKEDQKTHAQCLYQIIEQNKKLSKKKKITMVGFSDNIDPSEKNTEEFQKAVKACEKAGIMVWFCGDYKGVSFIPNSDKNNFENLAYESWETYHMEPDLVYVPSAGRTTAYEEGNKSYIYWSQGSLSWTMPYMIGLYGIVKQIDPSLTQEDIEQLVVETAYVNSAGMRIVDPAEFVCTVLDKVGKKIDAKKIRAEVKARRSYTYAIMNTALLSAEDVDSISKYLSSITDSTVLIVDASAYGDIKELYDALVKDHKQRGGKVAGIQIFGTPDAVPAFSVSYRVQMEKEIDEGGTILTDFFYGNFNNKAGNLDENYSVYDQFKKGKKIDLIPQWPVVRLPLEKGEFKKYFTNYNKFSTDTALKAQTLVNFSNPIFAQKEHSDDMGGFLQRITGEFKIKLNYRLYGNKDGQYPVTTKVLGNYTATNLKKENKKGTVEFVINSHGQRNNIDQATFSNNKEKRKSFINSDNINSTLSSNYYYLDLWTCNNGYEMRDNLVTTALNGKCIGAFASTSIISNNGVDNKASLSRMKKSNFYYFYYNYFKALGTGNSRTTSFYKGQKAYAQALVTESKKKINYNANYQFNMYNLLCYENFGVISSNPVISGMYIISNEIKVSDENNMDSGNETFDSDKNQLTDGKPIEDEVSIDQFYDDTISKVKVNSITYQKLDNQYYRFRVKCDLTCKKEGFVFNPPDGNVFKITLGKLDKGNQTLVFDISEDNLKNRNIEGISINLLGTDDTSDLLFIHVSSIH